MRNPTLAKNIESLEMIQHRAVRVIVRFRCREYHWVIFSDWSPVSHTEAKELLVKILREKQNSTFALVYDDIRRPPKHVNKN